MTTLPVNMMSTRRLKEYIFSPLQRSVYIQCPRPWKSAFFSVVVVFYVYNATAKMLRTPQSRLFPVLIGGPSEITLPSAWDRNLRRHRTGCLVSQVLHQQDEAFVRG